LVSWDSNDHQPVFSPDGKDVAFISTKARSEGTDLYVILDVDKKIQDPTVELKPIKLTSSATGVLYPAWSPDGQFLALTIEETENGVLNDGISVIQFGKIRASLTGGEDATGKAAMIRATSPEVFGEFHRFDEVAASWSPDGSYLSFYLSEHAGGRRTAKKEERVQSNLGVVLVKSFDGNVAFSGLGKAVLVDKVLDPNADSFLRGPVWGLDSRQIFVAKDAPEQDNPIRIVSLPGGETKEETGTKLNRDLFAMKGSDGLTAIAFSAHDRQTTSIYRCELR
jgi:dipeptidyl aminopeptidase/acylaminoacyl peptidase